MARVLRAGGVSLPVRLWQMRCASNTNKQVGGLYVRGLGGREKKSQVGGGKAASRQVMLQGSTVSLRPCIAERYDTIVARKHSCSEHATLVLRTNTAGASPGPPACFAAPLRSVAVSPLCCYVRTSCLQNRTKPVARPYVVSSSAGGVKTPVGPA
ncbi:hypothetical protein IG631_08456 [Alternaria alternata]|nr:hypothetical protein IG631_08456 [Alternaria alternata]